MRCALKDRNLKARVLRRARELREVLASLFSCLFCFLIRTFDYPPVVKYNYDRKPKEVATWVNS